MIIIYVDIVLLAILMALVVFTCGYCLYRLHRMQQRGQVAILLKPTRVLFSHRKEGESTEELRTVVAYQNPFTGDYCVHKSRARGKCYVNPPAHPAPPPRCTSSPGSPDSGLSDAYEPLDLAPEPRDPGQQREKRLSPEDEVPLTPAYDIDSRYALSKAWSWNYTEYQI